MGMRIEQNQTSEAERQAFRQRLEASLEVLEDLLGEPAFGRGQMSLGAELECSLVNEQLAPLPANRRVLTDADHPRWTTELVRFNLEVNAAPVALAGRPFSALGAHLEELWEVITAAAGRCGGRVVPIGILPTARPEHVTGEEALTEELRYRALARELRRRRGVPFEIDITGTDQLTRTAESVALQGVSTAFQLHLSVEPARFGQLFDAAQLATGPVLAAAANSPLLLGRRLWAETRLALFEQALDDRPPALVSTRLPRVGFAPGFTRRGALGVFEAVVGHYEPLLVSLTDDSLQGDPPTLEELRLHASTVWWWNRPVYDPTGSGDLRIELRVLPAGPTVPDMLANAALLVGLTLGLAPQVCRLRHQLGFARAQRDWYRAARHGLDAELVWPGPDGQLRKRPAARLVADLLPVAHRGLCRAGVEDAEASRYLQVVAQRVAVGQTGASWQLATLEALRDQGHPEPARGMLGRYLDEVAAGRPVHRWARPKDPVVVLPGTTAHTAGRTAG